MNLTLESCRSSNLLKFRVSERYFKTWDKMRQTHRHVCWQLYWSWNQASWGWTASWCWRGSSSVWPVAPGSGQSWLVPKWHCRSGNCRLDLSRGTAEAVPPIDPPHRRDAWWHLANLSFLPAFILVAVSASTFVTLSSLENENFFFF